MAESRRNVDMKPDSTDSPWKPHGLHGTLGLGAVTAGGVGPIIYVLLGAVTAHAGAADDSGPRRGSPNSSLTLRRRALRVSSGMFQKR